MHNTRNLPRGATWNMELGDSVCLLSILVNFWTSDQHFCSTQFLGTIFLISNSGWSETKLPDFWTVLTFPDWGLNSDRIRHFFGKITEKFYYFLICSEGSLGCYGWVVAVLSSVRDQGTGLFV